MLIAHLPHAVSICNDHCPSERDPGGVNQEGTNQDYLTA